jgi:pantothenate kinase
MMKNGFTSSNKFRTNLSKKIDKLIKKLKNIAKNHNTIGRVSKKECRIFLNRDKKFREITIFE